MARSLVPDFSNALAELRSLMLEDVNLPEALDHVAKAGLPLFVCEIDTLATEATGDLVLSYKVSDELKVSLAAMGTGTHATRRLV